MATDTTEVQAKLQSIPIKPKRQKLAYFFQQLRMYT